MSKKKNKQLKKQQQTTRQLIGIEGINDYCLQTAFGDLVFFSVKPTNISVLSDENLSGKINSLTTVLKSMTEIEILCINSRENFDGNKSFLKQRFEAETKRAVKELLQQESEFLDHIQAQTAATREFLAIVRLRGMKEKEIYPYLSRVEKVFKEQGFLIRQLGFEEIKILLGVFFEQNVTSEKLENYDGVRWSVSDDVSVQPHINERKPFKKNLTAPIIKDFFDMVAPSVIKFYTDYYICGNTYRCVWALREYPTSTSEQALLRYLGEKENVSLRIFTRQVNATEERKIIANAASKNRLARSRTNDLQQTVAAESNLLDVTTLVANMHRNREPLMHTAVYIELLSNNIDDLRLLQTEAQTELVRTKLNVDRLLLRQQQGFMCVMPNGRNVFREQFERVLPASSVANLYPFSFSGKTDEQGFYLGRDKFGSNIIVDFNKRSDDKTNANILILGNSGQGKSYLLKLILTNLRMSGKRLLVLDPEQEYVDLTNELGGCYIDLMSGEYIINVLEPKSWEENAEHSPLFASYNDCEENVPKAFLQSTKLSQHISFLRDFFRTYKDFSEREIDTIELMLIKLYDKFNITDNTDFNKLKPGDYPVLSDLYALIEHEHKSYNEKQKNLYTEKVLQDVCLGLHSICVGAESRFFNGYTNIMNDEFVTFGVKGLLQASKNIRNALLFNVLSYMSDKLLTEGNTVASVDEFYLFLTNLTAVEYIRNFMKRVRKKESAVILASQNIEDFLAENVRELTKPLFAIPTHHFLFNAGTVDSKFYTDALQLEPSEFNLIRYPQRGVCLYKCGNERFNLMVKAPEYKAVLFGSAGGR